MAYCSIRRSSSTAAVAAASHTSPARAPPQRGCVGRHLANGNEIRVSGSDSYALLFLFTTVDSCMYRDWHWCSACATCQYINFWAVRVKVRSQNHRKENLPNHSSSAVDIFTEFGDPTDTGLPEEFVGTKYDGGLASAFYWRLRLCCRLVNRRRSGSSACWCWLCCCSLSAGSRSSLYNSTYLLTTSVIVTVPYAPRSLCSSLSATGTFISSFFHFHT